MLKLFIHIVCDDCGKDFLFARQSEYKTESLAFNLSALSAMLPHYRWDLVKKEASRYHYCPDCGLNFLGLEEELAADF
jgi:hypothetical protein